MPDVGDFDCEGAEIFERLYERVEATLEMFGRPNYLPGQRYGDYSVHGDYSEYPQVVVFVNNLDLLRPSVVNALQQLLTDFPGWQIDLMVAVRGHYSDWPNMGLSIRKDEVLDGLQRQYFPKAYQGLAYEGGRVGSVIEFLKR